MLISRQLQYILNNAAIKAEELNNEFITIEHLFFSVLDSSEIISIIESLDGNVMMLKAQTDDFLRSKLEKIKQKKTPVPTIALERVLQRAAVHVQSSGNEEIKPQDILVAIFSEESSGAYFLLKKMGITRLDVVMYLSH